jgi:hypothetical protein
VILPILFRGFFPGFGLGFIIVALIAVWVGSDANKRGMNGIAWGIGVFLLCIVFLPIYLIVRKPMLAQQPYGYPPVQPPPGPYPPPPQAGHFCSNCGTHIDAAARFCPNCGKPSSS